MTGAVELKVRDPLAVAAFTVLPESNIRIEPAAMAAVRIRRCPTPVVLGALFTTVVATARAWILLAPFINAELYFTNPVRIPPRARPSKESNTRTFLALTHEI